jgi:hypothetical protein
VKHGSSWTGSDATGCISATTPNDIARLYAIVKAY